MKTIALRFSDNYAPKEGTIKLHNEIINKYGYVYYGKFGNPILESYCKEVLKEENPKFLLIKSGFADRYWAYIQDITRTIDEPDKVPEYYRNKIKDVRCWFKVTKIVPAEKNVMSKCTIISTGVPLSSASKGSMNPCFKISYEEGEAGE